MPRPELIAALALSFWPAGAFAAPVPVATATVSIARPVSLREALDRARARNRSLAAATADVERASALVAQVRAGWLPTLAVNASLTVLDSDRRVGDRLLTSADTLQGNVQLVVPLVAARAWLDTGRALDAVDLARASERDRWRTVAVATARVYLGVVQERQALRIAEQAVASSRSALQISSRRLREGAGARLEEARAERELRENESRLEAAAARVEAAREALGALVGEDGPLDAVELPELGPALALEAALGTAEDRADVAVERRRRGLAAERVGDGWAEFMPTLSAVLTPAVQAPTTATIPSPSFVGLLLLSVPLFDGGARYGRLDEREAVLHAAEATLEDARLRARSEVRAAHASLLHRARAREAAAQSAALAEETRRLVMRTFDEGTGTQLELIDAERAARDAATGRVLAEVAERSAVLDLLAAAGVFPDVEARP